MGFERNSTLKLGESDLILTSEYMYSGVWMSLEGCQRMKKEKISMTNQWVGRLRSVARMRASKYDVLRVGWCGSV